MPLYGLAGARGGKIIEASDAVFGNAKRAGSERCCQTRLAFGALPWQDEAMDTKG